MKVLHEHFVLRITLAIKLCMAGIFQNSTYLQIQDIMQIQE